MSATGMETLLTAGERLVAALEPGTSAIPTELQRLTDEDVVRYVARRQEVVRAIQNFDSDCTSFFVRSGGHYKQQPPALAKLRERLGRALARTIEADRLLLALAEQEKARLASELTAISLGRRALYGYGTKERRSSAALNRTA